MSITSLKLKFADLLKLRSDINNIFDTLDNKLNMLKDLYKKIVKSHSHEHHIFGIDSFYFQNNLIEIQLNGLKHVFLEIHNQMYCEYYNLYKRIQKYALNELDDTKIKGSSNFIKSFIPYKYLDCNKRYDINEIKELHFTIISCILELENILENKEINITHDKEKSDLGLNIDNIVYSELCVNSSLKSTIDMFLQYLSVFQDHNTKYFTRLLLKSKLQLGIVSEDIMLKSGGEMDLLKESIENLSVIKETEDTTLKNYINYEELSEDNKDVYNSIVSASSSSQDDERSFSSVE